LVFLKFLGEKRGYRHPPSSINGAFIRRQITIWIVPVSQKFESNVLRSTTELQTQKRVRLDLNQRLKTAIFSTNTASDDLNKPVSQ
jgi:hypothetical protein